MAQGPEDALPLVERLLKAVEYDPVLTKQVLQVRSRLKLPMSTVLARVPGKTVYEKLGHIGCGRQQYYEWMWGKSRPNTPNAKRLAKLTGFSVADIRGEGGRDV